MPEADDPRLAVEVGGRAVGARLDAAISRGALIRHPDGRLEPRVRAPIDDAMDAEPLLGAAIPLAIKRGCTNYELTCGPSDTPTASIRVLEAVEACLAERFVRPAEPPRTASRAMRDQMRLLGLVQIAFQIGDETYKDFTDGQPLRRPLVDYAPGAAAATPEAGREP